MNYEKNRFINNVYALAKKNKLKIGVLESSCGVSVGYFARLRQGGENAAPNAELLTAFADRLSVSLDALLYFDFTQLTESEQKLLNYLEKLRFETDKRKLAWRRDPAGCGRPVPLNPDGTSAHPLFINKEGFFSAEEIAEDDLPESVTLSETVYRSVFRPDLDSLVPLEIYRCAFPGKKVLYLVAIADPGPVVPGPAKWTELELVMTVPGHSEPLPFAHTDHENPGCLDKALVSLFNAVKYVIDLPALVPEAEAIIDDYLK